MSRIRRAILVRLAVALTLSAVALATTTPMAGATTSRLGTRVLRAGMRGADVRALQADLSRIGLPTTCTGRFDPPTVHSVLRFERGHRLAASGVVGRRFMRRLRAALEASPTVAIAA
ncbi:MAG TPA: peptidoglycan-binding domain-containing protein [Solirubrobacteraceae bacterium]